MASPYCDEHDDPSISGDIRQYIIGDRVVAEWVVYAYPITYRTVEERERGAFPKRLWSTVVEEGFIPR